MTSLSHPAASHITHPVSRSAVCLLLGAACLGSIGLLNCFKNPIRAHSPRTLPSPQKTILPLLSDEEIENLPYPPDALPGARDVDTPFGGIRVYEWGPEDGPRVLFIHGISTPSIALGGLAESLASKGCRVMLFDLFGRGYSSGPSPATHNYDAALYTTQILLCLASSPLSWRPITLVGYSLGGALAADFTSHFPHLISNLFLIAPGGLIRTSHITWKSKLLYSTGGLLPEWVTESLVAKRLYTGPESAREMEPETKMEPELAVSTAARDEESETKRGLRGSAVYQSTHHRLLPDNPHSTVGNVVDWQIKHHAGFVPAFISSIRYAPIHEQQHRWRRIGEYLRASSSPTALLKEVHLVLGETDPIIIAEEVAHDAREVLGEEAVRLTVMKGVGHEVAIEKAEEIADLIGGVLGR